VLRISQQQGQFCSRAGTLLMRFATQRGQRRNNLMVSNQAYEHIIQHHDNQYKIEVQIKTIREKDRVPLLISTMRASMMTVRLKNSFIPAQKQPHNLLLRIPRQSPTRIAAHIKTSFHIYHHPTHEPPSKPTRIFDLMQLVLCSFVVSSLSLLRQILPISIFLIVI
jgi:hypothetical protein